VSAPRSSGRGPPPPPPRLRARFLAPLAALSIAAACGDDRPRGDAPGPEAPPSGAYDSNGRPPEGVRPTARPNVVVVCAQGVRADALEARGDRPPAMPLLAERARRGVRFLDAIAPAPWSRPSAVSLLTGLLPSDHNVHTHVSRPMPLNRAVVTLAEILSSAGWRTAAVSSPPLFRNVPGLDQGFAKVVSEEAPPPGLEASVRAWVSQAKEGEPSFLFLHARPMDGVPPPPGAPTEADAAARRATYETRLRTLDARLAPLLDEVETGLHGPDVVVFVSTHGEAFLEHGTLGGGGRSLHEERLRVPLVLWGPGEAAGERRGAASVLDVLPTVLGHLGLAAPTGSGGESLAKGAPISEDRAVFAQELCRVRSGGGSPTPHLLLAVRSSRWKYVADLALHRPDETRETLHDLVSDPGETRPVPIESLPREGAFAAAVGTVRAAIQGKQTQDRQLQELGYGSLGRSVEDDGTDE
jgi:arylsulfatase A-like enzyme